jgi:hypothetical protein
MIVSGDIQIVFGGFLKTICMSPETTFSSTESIAYLSIPCTESAGKIRK